ncbi:MAG TPA: ABC transporter substrate-binding protein [Bradyrhizobium sp.]|nr:ABC transporter substrate-binding protein [Bradyrhizobium sp.]
MSFNLRAHLATFAAAAVAATAMGGSALAQKQYDPGATDTEIKIGNFVPYSGPVSSYGMIGRTMDAYFKKINAEGGINGRKINFISYDDAFSPPKAVEQTRKLVESDEVLLIFGALGTPSNTAIQKYLNAKKIPQLFIFTGATKWDDPKNFPWTMSFIPSYQTETRIYAKHILKEKPNAKIAVLYQNDDYGKDFLKGLKDGLGDKVNMIVAESSYEVSEPTVDSHIVKLKASGADVFVDISTPKFAAQTIRKMAEIDWKPMHFLNSPAGQVGGVLKPAGLENSQGIISASWTKDTTDPQWKDDPAMKRFFAFLDKYYPDADRASSAVLGPFILSQAMVQVLKQAGDDVSRENVMKEAANLKNVALDGMLPGITANTSPTDFSPIKQMRLMRFKGEAWEPFGPILGAETTN